MIINKNNWHYRLQKTFGFEDSLSLCSYFWKTVGAMILVVLLRMIFVIIFFLILLILLVAPAVGFWPRGRPFWDWLKLMSPIPGDEKLFLDRKPLFKIGRASFYAYQFLLIFCFIYLFIKFPDFRYVSLFFAKYMIGMIGSIIAIIFFIWSIYIAISKIRRTETGILLRGYAKAVKSKVCPLIEYRD